MGFRETTAGKPGTGKVSFVDFPDQLTEHVKDYVAYAWLGHDMSNSWIRGMLASLRLMARVLSNRYGEVPSPLVLDREDARSIEEHIAALDQKGGRVRVSSIAQFVAFLREHHDGRPEDFWPDPGNVPQDPATSRSYSEGLERVIPDEVSSALMDALERHKRDCEARARQAGAGVPLSEVLYSSAVIPMIAGGRRGSEVFRLSRNPLRGPTDDELDKTGPGLWLIHENTKVGLGEQEAFIPEPLASLVSDAVERAREATRSLAEASGLDRLFLTDTGGGGKKGEVHTVSVAAFSMWLNGRMTDDGQVERPGFIHRYGITYCGQYYQIDPHQFRHTLAHKAYLGGAGYKQVGDHLGHKRTLLGLSPMTGVYIHGEKKDVGRIREMHARGTLVGKALAVINTKGVRVADLRPEDVRIWRDQGMIAQPTLYGH